ncbi:DNA-processing protein DprA [Janibacter sp. CX7]|uniref:DNA-processing protein DprA n=1 Tax=Janibacter sp. CX7 TaxID=2963431 RepID=UPI0020CE298B|nr:DNA-processing protein DprA [Janibacter sp. CX7]UTT67076.1 DNA-processing protein DprA [Janibacter sp. CX7]
MRRPERDSAPTGAEVARAHAMVGSDERRARVAWSRVLELRRERVSDAPHALQSALAEVGHVEAWHRLVDGDLLRSDNARARVAGVDVDGELDRVERTGARVVIPGDADWPDALDHPLVSPHLLHVRGQGSLTDLSARAVAIVGSRASTGYGEAIAREIGAGAAGRGWTVVSGAAFGIDAAAHQGALAVHGPAIAVLPCGPDRVYPEGNRRLVEAVAEQGVVITELAIGTVAMRHRFLSRNRIIAALSRATLVVEAGLRSGSLNTAGWAEAMRRPVGLVPGPVTQMSSAGCHEWIQKHRGSLVTDTADLLALAGRVGEEVDLPVEQLGPARELDALTPPQRRIHDLLSRSRGTSSGELAAELVLPVEEVFAEIATMSIDGWVEQDDGGLWRRAR